MLDKKNRMLLQTGATCSLTALIIIDTFWRCIDGQGKKVRKV